MLQGNETVDQALRDYNVKDSPALEEGTIELPCYNIRRLLASRDPRAVVEVFSVEIRLKLHSNLYQMQMQE